MDQISGVYAITHVPSGRSYIGSSRDIVKRWAGHQKSLTSRTHHSCKLQRAWNKYGADAFHFIILEQCTAIERTHWARDPERMAVVIAKQKATKSMRNGKERT